ncbi:MAG TPA: MarR family winged helix-turn-helix transcriptional regulator [Acidimicrobiia bacterium]|jgi:DNA-binding MarR family transcriptional regulator
MGSGSAVRWLDADEQATWRAFNTVSRLIEGALDRQLTRDSGMSHAHYATLVALAEAEDGIARMGDLAEFLQYSPSRMSHAVRRMERNGWVVRRRCQTDGRGQEAVLTAKGRRALEAAAPGHVAEVRRMIIDRLTSEQQWQLRAIARSLLDAIDE